MDKRFAPVPCATGGEIDHRFVGADQVSYCISRLLGIFVIPIAALLGQIGSSQRLNDCWVGAFTIMETVFGSGIHDLWT